MDERSTSAAVLLRPHADKAHSPDLGAPVALSVDLSRGGSVVVGTLVGMMASAQIPLVTYPGQALRGAVEARTTVHVASEHVGGEVVLMVPDGDRGAPIIIGCVLRPAAPPQAVPAHVQVEADGDQVVITAQQQLTLRCGKASITLTRDGKVLLQGTYLSHRSSGVLRLKAGAVQIN